MKSILNWPPQAAPGSVIQALHDLVGWKMQHISDDNDTIKLRDAQQFLKGRLGLTDIWFEGPNGEPPFFKFYERVQQYVIGNEHILRPMCATIAAWVRNGGELPVFFLGGETGSGKDTIFAALNMVMFGHDGAEMMFIVTGKQIGRAHV